MRTVDPHQHVCEHVERDSAHEHDGAVDATGSGGKSFSPIHAVTNGTSDSQNSRCTFAQRIPPVTRSDACSMW